MGIKSPLVSLDLKSVCVYVQMCESLNLFIPPPPVPAPHIFLGTLILIDSENEKPG